MMQTAAPIAVACDVPCGSLGCKANRLVGPSHGSKEGRKQLGVRAHAHQPLSKYLEMAVGGSQSGGRWCVLGAPAIASSVGGTIAAVLISTLIVYAVVVHQRRKKLPPGPWPWPIVGNLGVLSGLPHRNLQKLAAKHGGLMYLQLGEFLYIGGGIHFFDLPLDLHTRLEWGSIRVGVHLCGLQCCDHLQISKSISRPTDCNVVPELGQVPCLAVCTAAAAKELFKTHDAAFSNRPKRLDHQIIAGTTYKSLTSAPYGPYWRQVRRVCNAELFSPARHASHESVRQDEIHSMMKVLLVASRTGEAIDLQSWATGVTANNMTRMLINKR